MKTTLKISLYALIMLFISQNVIAQKWLESLKNKDSVNFFDIQKAFNDYWKDKTPSAAESENLGEGGYQQFKRWEYFMKSRVDEKGNFNPRALWNEYTKYKSKTSSDRNAANRASWTCLGPHNVSSTMYGAGRVNVLRFNPNNSNIMWAGTPDGGLWKSTNGGSSWFPITDFLSNISVADIAIDPQNTNNMYMATGDGKGYVAGFSFWGGTYSAGILKSTDGGNTWNATSLSYSQTDGAMIRRVIINPVNPQILYAAADDGIWKSTNAGVNWTKILTGYFFDVELNITNPSTIYAAGLQNIYLSTNDGAAWNSVINFSSAADRIKICVTPANPQIVYALASTSSLTGNLYKSTNGGSSFVLITNTADVGYGYYGTALAVSPTNENELYTHGLDVNKSTNGGVSWSTLTDWMTIGVPGYVHADGQFLTHLPGNGNVVFSCNDGGIYKSSDGGTSWIDLNNGFEIAQFYRLGCSASNPNYVICGQQDNGALEYNNGNWNMLGLGDGMEQVVDYSNINNLYVSFQNGWLEGSTDGGFSFSQLNHNEVNAPWTTPIIMDHINPQTIYLAGGDFNITTDGGVNWGTPSTISNLGANTLIQSISDPNTFFTSDDYALLKSGNGGNSWASIKGNLPIGNGSYRITSIAVCNTNKDKIWVTMGGYNVGGKVYYTNNGGTSWTNVSGTLPNIPVNCILYQNGSNDLVYIGTDFGVFYKDNSMNDWQSYGNGLPNVIVNELEIQYTVGKLRAATYGRGLWEIDIAISTGMNENAFTNEIKLYPNPNNGKFIIESPSLNVNTKIVVYNILGENVFESKINLNRNEIDLQILPAGNYILSVETAKGIEYKKINIIK